MEVSANDSVADVCCWDTAKLTGPLCSEYFERGDVNPFRIGPLLYLNIEILGFLINIFRHINQLNIKSLIKFSTFPTVKCLCFML